LSRKGICRADYSTDHAAARITFEIRSIADQGF
jgi:hypothetical protein